jgi:hypothetical protein
MRVASDFDLRRTLVAGGLRTADRLTADRQASLLEDLHLSS